MRAGKLTWVSLSVGQHSTTAPAIVRARRQPSATRFATLLQPRRLAVHTLLEHLGRSMRELKQYMVSVALHVLLPVSSQDSNGWTSGVFRNTDLRQNASFSQILPTYVWTLPAVGSSPRWARSSHFYSYILHYTH